MAYKYCTATNWGKNFFTHEDRKNFYLSGHAGDQWIGKVNGAIKTKEEAQSIVDGKIEEAQTAYDALSDEERELQARPVKYNLP